MIGHSRVHDRRTAEQVAEALRLIGPVLSERLAHVQFVIGVDPVFVGLHRYVRSGGAVYAEVPHVAYPFHIEGPRDRRVTTIVLPRHLPGWRGVHDIVHEMGHALHEVVGFGWTAAPTTRYSRTNRYEAFAEAFVEWVWSDRCATSERDKALFRSLCR